jgi:DNA-directed RNA polymerase subunit beta
MSAPFSSNRRTRKNFASVHAPIELPYLIDLQKRSFDAFLQRDVRPDERDNSGLQAVFTSVFPIEDFNKTASLEFESYALEEPKYDELECRYRGMTYEAPLKVTVRLVIFDTDEETGTKNISSIKEQEVYLGNIPLMTDSGSFIFNGTERVIVSQLHRSPGVIFEHDSGKTHSSGKLLYSARIIPHRGSWLDFEFDHKDIMWVRIDRKRKLHASIVLRALGLTEEQILKKFYEVERVKKTKDGFSKEVRPELLKIQRAGQDILDPKSKEVLVRKNRKFTRGALRKIEKAGLTELPVQKEELLGRIVCEDVAHPKTGEVILEANEEISEEKLEQALEAGIKEFPLIFTDPLSVGSYIRDTMIADKTANPEEALIKIFERMRPGEPATLEAARQLFDNMFFDPDRYDLSNVGRMKINYKFPQLQIDPETTTLTKEDIYATLRYLADLNDGRGQVDEIDHLGNRRVRPVGELLENQFRVGLVRMERAIRERMSIQEVETLMPHDLVNQKPVAAAIKEFYGSSQLSQFMDQTNPLSEVTHKRRLSALGPGGLTRERAGFEVRDVHPTHYGRICPIETPEGPNIGLIASLSSFAQVSDYGFIQTPYRVVKDGKPTTEIRYLSAAEEEERVIAQASNTLEAQAEVETELNLVPARKNGEFALVPAEEVELMDVSPNQLVSVASSLIPFLEHDDANRALMGSNMMRQAVPLMKTAAPFVGTGIESSVARDSGSVVIAKHSGEVLYVDAENIVVKRDEKTEDLKPNLDFYRLVKNRRSNQNTCLSQKALVGEGMRVEKGDILADGPATNKGELALGQNALVAFMPAKGYNFEDSIYVSERMITDDVFTSVHVEEYECDARDTKLGKEEITQDIPNVSEQALSDLDESGIIRVGAEVRPGDILVGKVTPKGETQLSPEEKLLRAIFGEKAGDVKDTSLRAPTGINGTVVDAKVFTREGTELDERAKQILEEDIQKLRKQEQMELKSVRSSAMERLEELLVGQKTTGKLLSEDGTDELLQEGEEITRESLEKISFELIAFMPVKEELEQRVTNLVREAQEQIEAVQAVFRERVNRLKRGDELLPGVIKKVKVWVAIKRKIQVGDKMAGRHGNKGVISKIVPVEDMPYLSDGSPVDIVLNPLGVPSRMNIGQLLELTLGWAAKGLADKVNHYLEQWNEESLRSHIKSIYSSEVVDKMVDSADEKELKTLALELKKGVHISTPVFDGAKDSDIRELLDSSDLPLDGRTTLYDGVTGEAFAEEVTVGYMYMLKLHHLVDEKIHARSIGPYSLVTQQPLGGKAQFGGQRLGEMEVWAMEAYGSAYCLQEFLTVKSDDVIGRTRMYEAIVKGDQVLEPGLPESFNVLIKELQSLALNVELIENTQDV